MATFFTNTQTFKYSIIFLFACFSFSFLNAQVIYKNSADKKTMRTFQAAMDAGKNQELDKAQKYLESCVTSTPNFIDAHYYLADLYQLREKYDKAVFHFNKVIELDAEYKVKTHFKLARVFMKTHQYDEAIEQYEILLTKEKTPKSIKENAPKNIELAKFRKELVENPLKFEPYNFGDSINTKYYEYFPMLTADNSMFLFTRRVGDNEDFYYSTKNNVGEWKNAISLSKNINTKENEGAPTLAPDGKTIYFTACNRDDGYGSCDIYVTKFENNIWSKPKNVGGKLNSAAWESQPSISPDGKELYFVSNRKGGKGKKDIWVSQWKNNNWQTPINLGENINTKGDEQTPFIHADNYTLYFSSDTHLGMGKEDIFYTRRGNDMKWKTAKNVGFPINSDENENGLFISLDGKMGLFSSARSDMRGKLDLYYFEVPEAIKPLKVTYVKGKVIDKKTKEAIKSHILLVNLLNKEDFRSVQTDKSGEFLLTIPVDEKLAFNVSKNGYLFYSNSFDMKQTDELNPIELIIELEKIEKNATTILKNVFFDTDKFDLLPESYIELDKLFNFLTENSSINITIEGHTDNIGNDIHNLELSKKRAKSVKNYLIKLGIDENRLKSEGFGSKSPIAENDTEQGRKENRRTSFKINE